MFEAKVTSCMPGCCVSKEKTMRLGRGPAFKWMAVPCKNIFGCAGKTVFTVAGLSKVPLQRKISDSKTQYDTKWV